MMAELERQEPQRRQDRAGPEGPLRRCIATRAVLPKSRLIRFALGPDFLVAPDLEGKLPGRGLWLQARRDVVETACARNLFAKAARSEARLPAGLADRIEAGLRRRCLDALGLARRAGRVVVGYEQVKSWLREGRAGVLAEAIDGSEAGRAKLGGRVAALPLVELFTAAELGAALGRDHAVHVALAPGALARRFLGEATRLAGFAASGRVVLPDAAAALEAAGRSEAPR
jgi:predicted RNA-binding protein YlxR (DUF448 family)